jgi:hypothetical protein
VSRFDFERILSRARFEKAPSLDVFINASNAVCLGFDI